MPEYDLYVVCAHCRHFHDALLRVSLEKDSGVLRVSDVYKKNVPPHFYQAIAQIRCPETNKPANQKDLHMMVLAKVGRWSLRGKPGASKWRLQKFLLDSQSKIEPYN